MAHLFLPYRIAMQAVLATALSGLMLVAAVGVVRIVQKNRQAFYFISSLSGFLTGAVLIILVRVDLIKPSLLTEYGLHIGVAVEMAMLSLGLGDRINTLEREKRAAQQSIVASQHQQMERLKEMDRLKDEFLANTSHELRTPLHGIMGIVDSLKEGAAGPLNSSVNSNLTLVSASARRLANLVNDILDHSRLEHEDLVLRRNAVDIQQLANLALALSQPLVAGKSVLLETDFSPDLPAVWADEGRLEQILLNLIGNAIKFTKEGTVTVSARRLNGHVELAVTDTGIGIPREKQSLIFESFTQADGSISREYGGAGLGLSVSKRLVELHGGKLQLHSSPGSGARFFFQLPVAPANMSEADAPQSPKADVAKAKGPLQPAFQVGFHPDGSQMDVPRAEPLPKAQVLVVDDDATNVRVLRNYLTLRGQTVTDALNGRDALALLERQSV